MSNTYQVGSLLFH